MTHTPQTCRWAQPTLFLPLPNWIDAWDAPWSCVRDAAPRLLEMTTECNNCPRFELRAPQGTAWVLSQIGL